MRGAEIGAAAARLHDALGGVSTAIADQSDRLSAHAGTLDSLRTATEGLEAKASSLAGQMAQHVTDATDVHTLIATSIVSLDLFPDHSTPEWVQLAANLATAQAKADVVMSAATVLQALAAQIEAAAQQLKSDVLSLIDEAHELATAAANVRDMVSMIIGAAQGDFGAALQSASDRMAALGAKIDAARSNLDRHDREGRANADATRQQSSTKIAAKTEETKASLGAALASAQSKAAEASARYAQLLALSQLGLANRLPGGNATGATVQSGSFVFKISGTS